MRIYSAEELVEITGRVRAYERDGRLLAIVAGAFGGFVVGLLVAWWKWA